MNDENTSQAPPLKSGCSTVVLFGILPLVLLCVGLGVWGSIRDPEPRKSEPTSHMRGSVLVTDQRACADGPMLRIHIDNRDVLPLKYDAMNAPCVLRIDHDIPEGDRYRFEVKPLPPVVKSADDLRTSDGTLSVDVSLRP